jgi:hypothetical protein
MFKEVIEFVSFQGPTASVPPVVERGVGHARAPERRVKLQVTDDSGFLALIDPVA